YWPATTVPGFSFGVNENRVPSCGQKPSVRPGLPFSDRPTGLWQVLQNRLSSGTCGSLRMALAGSTRGTSGTSTSPAPSRLRDVPVLVRPEPRRVGRLPPVLVDEPPGGVAAAVAGPLAASAAGASPQVSHHPPSIVPSQPGRPHGRPAAPMARGRGGAACAALRSL